MAIRRHPGTPSVAVVNELLKSIVRFRERSGRIFVCATNTIHSLDPAFLRHGRFDYVIPVGAPDAQARARAAMWRGYTHGDDAGLPRRARRHATHAYRADGGSVYKRHQRIRTNVRRSRARGIAQSRQQLDDHPHACGMDELAGSH